MKRWMMTMALVLAVLNAWAEDVSQSEAMAKAQQFISQKYGKCSLTPIGGNDRQAKGAGDGGEADCFYVFNVGNEQGFVIVSADDRTESILGYSEHGTFEPDQLPDNVKAWLEGYNMEIRYIRENNIKPNAKTRGTKAVRKDISPLIKTTWGQGKPYNNGYPTVNYQTCITGCVATALAQVINYHRYPKGNTTQVPGYTTWTYRIIMPSLPPVTFDWDNMADSYQGYTTTAQKKAVSTLMRYCSTAVEADLGPNSTGAYPSALKPALQNYFGYSNDIRFVYRSSYNSYTWEDMMYAELQASRPILYGGSGSVGGHRFILDGYKDGEGFHVNWGWNGSYDGYFQLSAMMPLTGYDFNYNQNAVIGISPKGGVSGKEFEVNGLNYRIDENYDVSVVSIKDRNTSNVVIPNTVYYNGTNYTVTSIGNSAFEGCVNMTSVSIPRSIKNIGAGAFYGCSGLRSVDIPEGVTKIGEGAFSKCGGLTSVVVPSSVTSIDMFAFYYCTNLNQVISKIQSPFDVDNTVFTTYSTTTLVTPIGKKTAYQAKSGWKNFSKISDGTYENPKKLTIHVAQAGTLPYLISEDQKYQVEELTLTGELNGTDFRLIRDMAGINYCWVQHGEVTEDIYTDGKLKSLNLSGAKIVKGGNPYYEEEFWISSGSTAGYGYSTENNKLTSHLFYGTKLKSIILPISVSEILASAFQGSNELTSIVVDSDNEFYDSRDNCNAVIESSSNTLIAGCKNTTIPYSVTSIGNDAFRDCRGLTSIVIPNNVTSIGNSAFYGCSGLTTITSEIQNPFVIDDYVFPNYDTATLTVPAGMKSVYQSTAGWKKFQNIVEAGGVSYDFEVGGICYKIGVSNTVSVFSKKAELSGDIVIPSQVRYNGTNYTVTSIGESAFEGCTDVTSVSIPNSITTIEVCAFEGCIGLSAIEIPNGVTSIDNGAFYYCTGLKTVDIPNGVTTIGEGAFSKCGNLTSVTIPATVTSIGVNAFSSCTNLAKITSAIQSPFTINKNVFATSIYSTATLLIPSGTKAAYQAKSQWNLFTNIVEIGLEFDVDGIRYKTSENNTVSVIPKSGSYSGDVVIPDQVSYNGTNYTVTSIGKSAFEGCSDMTSVSIPGSVTIIGGSAFEGCTGLSTIVIPNGVTTIDNGAFYSCTGLQSVDIPEGVTTIGEGAFSRCSNLASVIIPSSVTFIDSNAFYKCSGLTQITSGIQNPFAINRNVFPSGVYVNAILLIPAGTMDAYQAASGWKKFENIVEVGQEFESDGLIYKVGGNYTVSVIQKSDIIFDRVIIPDQVSYNGTTYLVTSIGESAFEGCTDITSVSIPSSVKDICAGAFYYCTGLQSVDIPEGVTTIGNGAFSKCSGLTSVTIPGSVTSIGKNAFFQCYALTQITSGIENPFTIDDGVFPTSVYNNASLQVPSGKKSAYQNTAGWKRFQNIVEIGQEFESDGIRYRIGGNYTVSVIEKSDKYSGDVIIPEQVKHDGTNYTVTSIGESAFEGCVDMTSVSIPSSVKNICAGAFYFCTGLQSVDIPNGVTTIGNGAFSKCSNLASVTIPGSIVSIDNNAFYKCTSLTLITSEIQNPFTIEKNVFATYTTATLFVLSGTKAAYQSTSWWNNFQNIVEVGQEFESDGIRYRIGGNYTVSVIEKSDKYSGDVVIPDQVKHDGTNYTVTSIGESAFEGCVDMTSVSIPSSVKNICAGAFYYCTGLQSVVIPNGVIIIGEGAFSRCGNLTSVTIPGSVTFIDSNAFYKCSGLTQISSGIQNPFAINRNIFASVVYVDATLIVPYGTKTAYQSTSGWKYFTNIKENIKGDVNLDGEVNKNDLTALEAHIMGKNPDDFYVIIADLNGDGEVNVADIVELLKIMGNSR